MSSSTTNNTLPIILLVEIDGRNALLASIDRSFILKHSNAVQNVVKSDPKVQDVVLRGVSKGPLELVLGELKKWGDNLHLNVSKEPFERALPILQAVTVLDVQPAQPQVEKHVVWAITQHQVTAQRAEAIAKAAPMLGEGSKPVVALLQSIAYNVWHETYTNQQREDIKAVAERYPFLDAAVADKIGELKAKRNEHLERIAYKQRREE